MKTYLSETEISFLKLLINKKNLNIIADNWDEYNRSYGNILISTPGLPIEINHSLHNSKYFNDYEELASYHIKKLSSSNDFQYSVMPENLKKKILTENITKIEIVRDNISLNYKNKIEKYVFDTAIIFHFSSYEWTISQQSIFIPMSNMLFGKDTKKHINSISAIKEEWADDDSDNPSYSVDVNRKFIVID